MRTKLKRQFMGHWNTSRNDWICRPWWIQGKGKRLRCGVLHRKCHRHCPLRCEKRYHYVLASVMCWYDMVRCRPYVPISTRKFDCCMKYVPHPTSLWRSRYELARRIQISGERTTIPFFQWILSIHSWRFVERQYNVLWDRELLRKASPSEMRSHGWHFQRWLRREPFVQLFTKLIYGFVTCKHRRK